jgi:S-adenosylmethionine-diacylglycerol 3-amino-3-carboxypropyl transferase
MSIHDKIGQAVFSQIHGGHLIYNTCWEDPRLDRVAMNLTQNDDVLVITSAGCNALDYALAGARSVTAVDVNPRQNALLELKIAGIRTLDFDSFFTLFGLGRHDEFDALYQKQVRHALSPTAQQYWDRHGRFFQSRARRSFYYHGTTGMVAWLMRMYVGLIARARDAVHACLEANSIDEQRSIYYAHVRSKFWKKPLKWGLNRDTTMSLLGVPRNQKRQIDEHYTEGVAGFVQECLDAVFGTLSLSDNYFWRVYLTGQYTQQCCPEYLRRDSFEKLKSGLVDRVSIHTDTVAGHLEKRGSDRAPISHFVLLDHQDWLSSVAEGRELAREWTAILKTARPGSSRVLFRSAGLTSNFVDDVIATGRDGESCRIGNVLLYDRPLAKQLHAIDRVHTYGSFHVADINV